MHSKMDSQKNSCMYFLVFFAGICMAIGGETSSESFRQWPRILSHGKKELDVWRKVADRHILETDRGSTHLSRTCESESGGMVYVFDDVIDDELFHGWTLFSALKTEWRFQGGLGTSPHLPPWALSVNTSVYLNSHLGNAVGSLIQKIKQIDGDIYYPYQVHKNVMRRGDVISPVPGSHDSDDLTVLVYLNRRWDRNDYGEILFLDGGDVLCAVTPLYGRVVIWDNSVGYLLKPPSFNSRKTQFMMTIKYTKDVSKVTDSVVQFQEQSQNREKVWSECFQSMKDLDEQPPVNVVPTEHLHKDFQSQFGQKLFVFNDLFHKEDLNKMIELIPDYGLFYFDDSFDEGSDNVQWISSFQVHDFIQSRMWPVVQKVAEYASGEDSWYPYDISCNIIRAYDSTQDHFDCEYEETEWTFLLYLTKNWTLEMGGETAFYEDTPTRDFITSVNPTFGRSVIFEGIIPHSARPPSAAYGGPRFTFAVKLAKNITVALEKMMKQEFAHEETTHHFSMKFLSEFMTDFIDVSDGESQEEMVISDTCLASGECQSSSIGINRYQSDNQYETDDEIEFEFEEDEFADFARFPEIKRRKDYVLKTARRLRYDSKKLQEHFLQFLADRKEIMERYMELIQLFL